MYLLYLFDWFSGVPFFSYFLGHPGVSLLANIKSHRSYQLLFLPRCSPIGIGGEDEAANIRSILASGAHYLAGVFLCMLVILSTLRQAGKGLQTRGRDITTPADTHQRHGRFQ